MRVHLLEPDAGGRISGGYLYNQRIAPSVERFQRHALQLDALERELARIELGEPALVLIDSLFLTTRLAPAFLRLRRPGLRLGVLMHALPSFIERAGDRRELARALPLMPTASELGLLAQLDLLVAPGPYIPRLLAQCGSPVRCVVCPPGVDRASPTVISRPRASHASVRLLSIGNVTPLKGFADAMAALATVGAGSWSWKIVGHLGLVPEHVASLGRMAREHGLEGSVHFAGHLSHDETLTELRRSDLLLIPSYTENCPLVAFEALGSAVPVVGYAVGGLPDIVHHGLTGLLAPLLDVATLAAHLDHLIADVEARQRLILGCTEAASRLISWEEAAQGFLSTLEREAALISSSAPPDDE